MNQDIHPKYCNRCGNAVVRKRIRGEVQPRAWCQTCEIYHYQNPTILVAVFLHYDDKLLWAQRGISPGKGKWAFPAGFAECGESLQQAAARELFEETKIGLTAEQLIPMSISSILAIDQIYMVFRFECDNEITASKTEETLDWGWFTRADAPWGLMAHQETKSLVEQVYSAVEQQKYFMRVGAITAEGNKHQSYGLSSNKWAVS